MLETLWTEHKKSSFVTIARSMWVVWITSSRFLLIILAPFHSLFTALGVGEWKVEKAAGEKWKSPNAAASPPSQNHPKLQLRVSIAAVARNHKREKKKVFSSLFIASRWWEKSELRLPTLYNWCRWFESTRPLKRGACDKRTKGNNFSDTSFLFHPPTHSDKRQKKPCHGAERVNYWCQKERSREIDGERSQVVWLQSRVALAAALPRFAVPIRCLHTNRHYSFAFSSSKCNHGPPSSW